MEPVHPHARARLLARLADTRAVDVVVVGGGATGLGCALDAAARGHSVLLVEAHDFAAGTSSRSTKLIHGGVRYLAQGRFGLVREALRERGHLLRNAPALVHPLHFVVPARNLAERLLLRVGLGAYEALAGADGLGGCKLLDAAGLRAALPGLRDEGPDGRGPGGGVTFRDAQFDDAGLALALARTASAHGALLLNHCEAQALVVEDGRVCGVVVREAEGGRSYRVAARVVINAAGVWGDVLRRCADPAARPLLRPSQGVHLVVDADCLPGGDALLVPHTRDGRVLFMIPWCGKVLIGTTDTPRPDAPMEPEPLAGEVDELLAAAARWLRRPPVRETVRSVFVGLRPLLGSDEYGGADGSASSRVSREHRIEVSARSLVSVLGGKWTTYRAMAEQAVDAAEAVGGLARRSSPTATLALDCGVPPGAEGEGEAGGDAVLPGMPPGLPPGLLPSAAAVRRALREDFALSIEDVLARRSRALFLDAAASAAVAPTVANLVAHELGWSAQRREAELAAFLALAGRYRARSRSTASSPPSG
ncbi:MAG: glycerol-3-phosphate dehydrogenase/oxidase [Thauera sp.]